MTTFPFDLGLIDGNVWNAADVDAVEAAINQVHTDGATTAAGLVTANTTIAAHTTELASHQTSIANAESAWTTYAPALIQASVMTPTTVVRAKYNQVGKTVVGDMLLTAGTTGSAGNAVIFDAPVAMSAGYTAATNVIGIGFIFDSSAGIKYRGLVVVHSTSPSRLKFLTLHSTTDGILGLVDFTTSLGSGDQICASFSYEAA